MTSNPQTLCRACVTPIGYIECPTGGWWAHEKHPADEHDAVPGAWVDGDELMEAIAAAIWEHCQTEGTSTVVDDPRNIAAVAAAVARAAAPAVPPEQPSRAAWADAADHLDKFAPARLWRAGSRRPQPGRARRLQSPQTGA